MDVGGLIDHNQLSDFTGRSHTLETGNAMFTRCQQTIPSCPHRNRHDFRQHQVRHEFHQHLDRYGSSRHRNHLSYQLWYMAHHLNINKQ